MFIGEYNHTLDAKGRLIVPSKLRESLGERFFLTKGLDGCLSVYPKEEWDSFTSKIHELPMTNKDARKFSRFSWPELRNVRLTSRPYFNSGQLKRICKA